MEKKPQFIKCIEFDYRRSECEIPKRKDIFRFFEKYGKIHSIDFSEDGSHGKVNYEKLYKIEIIPSVSRVANMIKREQTDNNYFRVKGIVKKLKFRDGKKNHFGGFRPRIKSGKRDDDEEMPVRNNEPSTSTEPMKTNSFLDNSLLGKKNIDVEQVQENVKKIDLDDTW